MKDFNQMKENYEKPSVQVLELQFESGILTSSSATNDNSVNIDDMGGWNNWNND